MNAMQSKNCSPVIKWAGGKRQLLPVIESMLPDTFESYYEPFFGGGALFCNIVPETATINDCNSQLINMYEQIKVNPDRVCSDLYDIQNQYNQKETMEEKDAMYYELREMFNRRMNDEKSTSLVAALLIFLNKAGFNGLYRVNSSGKYNVPPAHRKQIKAYEESNIIAFSKALKPAKIMCGDFEASCREARAGDFVFFDSPYYDTFDTYQAGGFSERDHLRLYDLFKMLSDKRVYCMLTNNDCDFIKNLYHDFNIHAVSVKRMINCDGKNRTGKEVIITNY